MSIIRDNLLTRKGYTPYCGNLSSSCSMPRSRWNGRQFKCHECGWQSKFDEEFISRYKERWDK